MKFNHAHLRGLEKGHDEKGFIMTVYNLKRAINIVA